MVFSVVAVQGLRWIFGCSVGIVVNSSIWGRLGFFCTFFKCCCCLVVVVVWSTYVGRCCPCLTKLGVCVCSKFCSCFGCGRFDSLLGAWGLLIVVSFVDDIQT
jgi:hypothetical protein